MYRKFSQCIFSFILLLGLVFGSTAPISAAPANLPHAESAVADADPFSPIVIYPVKSDTSPELLTMAVTQATGESESEIPLYQLPKTELTGTPETWDESSTQATMGTAAMPAPVINFEGVANADNALKVYPPDTEGDIGANHYVQWVNLSFAIWQIDRTNNTATKVYGPVPGNTLFAGFGGPCETTNSGDPITLYDPLADRWLMSQFAIPAIGPYFECIAVSQTNNPTGAWYRYQYQWPGGLLNDYPKFGVWPDAYYMTANQFDPFNWAGAGVAAFNRAKMIAGNPSAEVVYFNLFGVNPNFGGILPADFDGFTLPPAGAPGLFAEWDDSAWLGDPADTLRVWEFHTDWATPANSTFGLSGLPNYKISTTNVNPNLCGYDRNCIPQPGTTVKLDAISDRLMYRLQYRNIDGHQTLVSNHTVDATGGDIAGIHWFELRNTGSGWSMYQQGVYQPDSNNRWMGSAAMDHTGNIALGYSVSSGTVFPSIRYAGRLATDPLGQLPQAETQIIAGSGSQTGTAHRWGDYSMMAVDPLDDCTFWYTQEYVQTTGTTTWQTRVAAFKLPGCSLLTIDPDQLDVTLFMGESATVPIELTNEGSVPLEWYLLEENNGFSPLGSFPAYVPPTTEAGSALGVNQFTEANESGEYNVVSAPEANLLLNQARNGWNGLIADSDCAMCPTGEQAIAENFSLATGGTISQLVFWTGYYPGDLPMANDSFTVKFHADNFGVPGAVVSSETNVDYSRVQTGVVIFGVHEWMHTLTLGTPLPLAPGNYWVEIYNNTTGNSDNFFWETGARDPVAGLTGSAWATTTPGVTWNFDGSQNLSLQLIAGTSDVPWLSETPKSGTIPGIIPTMPIGDVPAPEISQGVLPTDALDTVNSPAPAETGEPSEIGLASVPYVPSSVLYDNGPLITHPGGGAGGADASALQTTLVMGTYGYGNQLTAGNRVADDFIISSGAWQIDSITFYGYQTGSTTTSTFNHVNLRIWDGVPGAVGSNVIWGDKVTNRLVNSAWTNIYRVPDYALDNIQRPIMANTVDIGVALPAGHYWLDWQAGGTLASGPWVPSVTILGQTSTGDGLQSTDNGTSWADLIDVGPQGLPFTIEGTQVTSSKVVQITFDASVPEVTQPGVYHAKIQFYNDHLVGLQTVTVTMHVINRNILLPLITKP